MEDTTTESKHDTSKVSKLPKAPNEPNFKGRPTKAASKRIKEMRLAHREKQKKIKKVEKLDLFINEWLKNDGNATKAAEVVFDCKNKAVAANIGSQYLKKAKSLARLQLEEQGYTYGKMLRIAGQKMEKSKNPEWWDRLMKLAGYEDFMSKKGADVSVNILTAQKDIIQGYVEEVEVVDDEE